MNNNVSSPIQTWDTIVNRINQTYQDKLVLEPNSPINVVFRGEPYSYEAVWQDPCWVMYDPNYPPNKNVSPALRVMINVTVIDEDVLKNCYFDMDVTTFKLLNHLRNTIGLDNIFEIEREDDDPIEDSVTIFKSKYLNDSLRNTIECLPLFDLGSLLKIKPNPLFGPISRALSLLNRRHYVTGENELVFILQEVETILKREEDKMLNGDENEQF